MVKSNLPTYYLVMTLTKIRNVIGKNQIIGSQIINLPQPNKDSSFEMLLTYAKLKIINFLLIRVHNFQENITRKLKNAVAW